MRPTQAERVEKIAVSAIEAAEMLSLSRSKIYEMMHAGLLPFLKFGKSRRILVSDIRKLAEANKRSSL